MEQTILSFAADEQRLTGSSYRFASNTVRYVKAVFKLGANWRDYDSVRAVWASDYDTISTVLDSHGACIVPHEVLRRTGKVRVNLVGSISGNGQLIDRLTTYPLEAIIVDKAARVEGTETATITPSQFEQYVEAVHEDAEDAAQYARDASDSADRAEQAAQNAGYMFFHVDSGGHLIYERTENVDVDFYIDDDGHLYVEATE